ncbi:MAG: hypothetical protein V2A58_11195 [Planctomycetota bacterium]
MPSDDFSNLMGGAAADAGEDLYTVLAALSAVGLAVAFVLLLIELWYNYHVILFKFVQ